MQNLVDPTLALRWLGLARRGTIAAQVLLMVAAEAGTKLHLHSPALIALVVAWGLWDAVQAAWVRRGGTPPRAVFTWATIDFVALSAILTLSEGEHNPLLFAYLAWLALLGMVLPVAQAWGAAIVSMVLQAAVILVGYALEDRPHSEAELRHLVSHVITFELSAGAITWVVTRLSATLREREAAERVAARQRAVTERLAALGTLAAGVAHELGTPLGAIQLLAEQARKRAARPDVDAPIGTLLEQVERCRVILERLRGRDTEGAAESVLELGRWIEEWRRAAPETTVAAELQAAPSRVVGSEESWRAALWVALDNARRAGATHIAVTESRSEGHVDVLVDDDGRGLDDEAARHFGEPFRTGWGGTGLGVFVSRSFAQSVGGDVSIEPRSPRGARVRIRVPEVPA